MHRAPGPHSHTVRFFQDDATLVETVSGFVSGGRALGEPTILGVTRRRKDEILAELARGGRGSADDSLAFFDAERAAEKVLVKGRADPRVFRSMVVPALKAAAARSKTGRVRVYGEVKDVLLVSGREEDAARIEAYWTELGARYPVNLLCGYRLEMADRRAWRLAESHDGVLLAHELLSSEARIGRVVDAALGAQVGKLQTMIAGERRLRDLPFGQAALLWLGHHMPATARKVGAALQTA